MRYAALVALLVSAACGGPHDGVTGDVLTDACLHWTACITPPAVPPSLSGTNLAFCVMPLFRASSPQLPWAGGGVPVTQEQLGCIAAARLDCDAALDCVSTRATTACPTPTWSCDGNTLTRCDTFRGDRVVTEDCAAAGLTCVRLGDEARCGLAACDPRTFAPDCAAQCQAVVAANGSALGGVVLPRDDCSAHDATCSVTANGVQCIGNGPSCTPYPGVGGVRCDGDALITCDASGHEERTDCTALGLHCFNITTPNPAGLQYACARQPELVVCEEGPQFGQCDGTTLQYCDERGNAQLDCKQLGYSDCSDGHCVP